MSEYEKISKDRRRFERKRVKIEVSFYKGGQVIKTANTRDIGLGGLYIASDAEVKVGDLLSLTIDFEEGKFKAEAAVVYVDEGQGFGVRFQNLSKESEELLKKAIEIE
ncbi:MAG: PilZ domain-containing protein [Pyrinomonadaceae bacterium]|nr:PilZ domain-containing protein [Pyrinomonadaceae bacterium]MCX7640618.1 PilZ domain-containing protein [Pyrinomonadaceae bacterium]MDW8305154.1 PilZ domain-containing protein [Acidobacteriota bacterium]